MIKLIVFCESPIDALTVRGLVDRVLKEHGPDWVKDLIDEYPESLREYIKLGALNGDFFDLHQLGKHLRELKKLSESDKDLRENKPFRTALAGSLQGRFGRDGPRLGDGTNMILTAFRIANAVYHAENGNLDAVLFIWDMDNKGDERRRGTQQVRDNLSKAMPFRIILGLPDPEREAWVISGFEPENREEEGRLEKLRSILSFCPVKESHRLCANDSASSRDSKKVLVGLCGNDREREARCWNHTSSVPAPKRTYNPTQQKKPPPNKIP